MPVTVRKFLILLGLLGVFIAPGVAALLVYHYPGFLPTATSNKGQLLTPPLTARTRDAQARWGLVVWNPGACAAACRVTLDSLSRLRLALGRRLYETRIWIVSDTPLMPDEIVKTQWKELEIQPLTVSPAERALLPEKAAVFLADPAGNWILQYAAEGFSAHLYHDLKKLLGAGTGSRH